LFSPAAFQVFTPHGKVGEVDVSVKLAGYDQKVLEAAQITNPVSRISLINWGQSQ
jgi:hypothetical protein